MLKLNLGCGKVYLDGYVNIDIEARVGCKPDLVADVLNLCMYGNDAVDYIHAYGLLEHIPPWDTMRALREWARILEPGGTIHIEVPDLMRILDDWVSGRLEENLALAYIFGGGRSATPLYEAQHHLTGFTFDRLARMMRDAGFVDIVQVESERLRWALAVDAGMV